MLGGKIKIAERRTFYEKQDESSEFFKGFSGSGCHHGSFRFSYSLAFAAQRDSNRFKQRHP